MTLTEFRALAEEVFGEYRAVHVVSSHHLTAYGETASEALDSGRSVKAVWNALCDDFDIAAADRDPER